MTSKLHSTLLLITIIFQLYMYLTLMSFIVCETQEKKKKIHQIFKHFCIINFFAMHNGK